jgi:putative transposase
MYGRRGSLFIPNFKRKEITTDDYFTSIVRYIHANPVHHGFVNELTDWSWSSFSLILQDSPTFLKREEMIAWFGNHQTFLEIHKTPIDQKLTELLE